MKNRLNILIIFAFIFSSCSDFSGNEDAVEASLKPGPVTKTTTPPSTTTKYDLRQLHLVIIHLLQLEKVELSEPPQIMVLHGIKEHQGKIYN